MCAPRSPRARAHAPGDLQADGSLRSCGQLPFGANDEVMQACQRHASIRVGLRVPLPELLHVRAPQARMMLEPLPGQTLTLRSSVRACSKAAGEVLEQAARRGGR